MVPLTRPNLALITNPGMEASGTGSGGLAKIELAVWGIPSVSVPPFLFLNGSPSSLPTSFIHPLQDSPTFFIMFKMPQLLYFHELPLGIDDDTNKFQVFLL